MTAVVTSDDEESFQVDSSVWGHYVFNAVGCFKAVWIPVYFQALASVPSFLVVEISSFERVSSTRSFS